MVAPLLEVLLLRVLRRRAVGTATPRPTRLVSRVLDVDAFGYVAAGTSVLLQREGSPPVVLPADRLVLPPLLPGTRSVYAVLTHDPVDVRLRLGPFDTLDGRTVHQVELRMGARLASSPSVLAGLVESDGQHRDAARAGDPDALEGFGDRLLDRLAREVSSRTEDAVRRRTLDDLIGLSLGVLLDESLPASFLAGAVDRTALEVLDVDWPTEGRGWPRALVALPGGVATTVEGQAPTPGPVGR